MNPITLILAAYVAATSTTALCTFLSEKKLTASGPKDAYTGLKQFLDKLTGTVDFVSVKSGVFCFWPKGTYGGVTYDGGISTNIIPNSADNTFTVVDYMFIKGAWKEAERHEYPALELLDKLRRNQGTAIGIPVSFRRTMADSSIHRRVACGITLSESADKKPGQ
ncbi:hypothetical protein [Nitrosospira sp. Nsp13]|uniref:hypothetical protein n=1 Tax=Nitrosospira sp. Nsp13 TaxID=1855332 RepID=UPI0008926B7D|nr:hypothetical protein [Nitrosospira sp. Nsp13]SCX76869.1 hypothetical protein SAMN05216308_10170 [Nitrosospira sp. Nsp13]